MVMRSLRLVVIFGTVAGCYSTPSVDPYPRSWLIDDFEDGDGEPEAYAFAAPVLEHWECRPKNSTHHISHCDVRADPYKPNNRVLYLGSTLWSSEEGEDFTRSEVAIFIDPPQDLTAYKSFSLRATLIGRETQPGLKFQLSCVQARTPDGGISPKPFILAPQEIDNPRTDPYKIALDGGFQIPAGISDPSKAVEVTDCLAQVDGIKITVDSDSKVPAGQTWTFDLYVDDIEFVHKN
jgi:hypothetical protein